MFDTIRGAVRDWLNAPTVEEERRRINLENAAYDQAQARFNKILAAGDHTKNPWRSWIEHRPDSDAIVETISLLDDKINTVTPSQQSPYWNVADRYWRFPEGEAARQPASSNPNGYPTLGN